MKTAEKIMQLAEQKIRQGGYHNFSFRDIAAEMGIKSASVHYHFPTKEDLVNKVLSTYIDNFFETLNRSEGDLESYFEAYKKAFNKKKYPCLCGVLLSESRVLSADTQALLASFVTQNIVWLRACLAVDEKLAQTVFNSFEGAMLSASIEKSDQPLVAVYETWGKILR